MSLARPDPGTFLLQPFYILSCVIGSLVGAVIIALSVRGCMRRRRFRQRFARAVDNGWAIPVFRPPDQEEANASERMKSLTNQPPVMRVSMLNTPSAAKLNERIWEDTVPLSMALLPVHSSRPHELLLYLLRAPSVLTSNLFQRLRAIGFLRSKDPQQQHFLPPSPSNPPDGSPRPLDRKASLTSSLPSPLETKTPKPKRSSMVLEPAQVMFVIAMPNGLAKARSSPAAAREPAVHIANRELCVGTVPVMLQVPVQYLKARKDDRVIGQRRELEEEEGEEQELERQERPVYPDYDYASTLQTRNLRSEDPGHEYARSYLSSRHHYADQYTYEGGGGDGESSYVRNDTASASNSLWDDAPDMHSRTGHEAGASVLGSMNSYLAPPSFAVGTRGDAQSHTSSYPPSRAFTPSILSTDMPPIPPLIKSTPSALADDLVPSTSSDRPRPPIVLINDQTSSYPAMPNRADGAAHLGHIVDRRQEDDEDDGLHVTRLSQDGSSNDATSASGSAATDAEGGYEADFGNRRRGGRLTLRPRGTVRKRGGGSR